MAGSTGLTKPIAELVRARYSCRTYTGTPLEQAQRAALEKAFGNLPDGPFSGSNRFSLAAAQAEDHRELRGLVTYGFIKDAPAYILGASVENSPEHPFALENFGYRMECLVLFATEIGLGTCWLGGTFNRSGFARRLNLQPGEVIPTVTAVGARADRRSRMDVVIRTQARGDDRLPWDVLFYDSQFGQPLAPSAAGEYAQALELLRLAPSASNKQPWRVVRATAGWHFYRQRTPGYRDMWLTRLLRVADMQRVDLGIGMCHFELAAREMGLAGAWQCCDPGLSVPDTLTEYVATWAE